MWSSLMSPDPPAAAPLRSRSAAIFSSRRWPTISARSRRSVLSASGASAGVDWKQITRLAAVLRRQIADRQLVQHDQPVGHVQRMAARQRRAWMSRYRSVPVSTTTSGLPGRCRAQRAIDAAERRACRASIATGASPASPSQRFDQLHSIIAAQHRAPSGSRSASCRCWLGQRGRDDADDRTGHGRGYTTGIEQAAERLRRGDAAVLAACAAAAGHEQLLASFQRLRARAGPRRPAHRLRPGAQPAAVGAGAHRLVRGILARAQPAARPGCGRRPRRPAHRIAAGRRRRAVRLVEGAAPAALAAAAARSRSDTRLRDRGATRPTLALLRGAASDDDALYFFRLVVCHQAMHIEAWHFMAQQLGFDLRTGDDGPAPRAAAAAGEWPLAGAQTMHRREPAPGLLFDNEFAAHRVTLAGPSPSIARR